MKSKTILNVFLLLGATFLFGKVVNAEVLYQYCQADIDCVLGEFLYDDFYNPITEDVCKVEIKNPNGNVVVKNASTTYGYENGWHEYVFSTSGPQGLYGVSLCCESGGEKICSDKSFILQTQDKEQVVVPSESPVSPEPTEQTETTKTPETSEQLVPASVLEDFATKKDLNNLKNLILEKINDLFASKETIVISDGSTKDNNSGSISGQDQEISSDKTKEEIIKEKEQKEEEFRKRLDILGIEEKIKVALTDFKTTDVNTIKISLSWFVFPSDYDVDYFLIYRNNLPIATTSNMTFTDSDLFPNTEYSYKVGVIKDNQELTTITLKTTTKPTVILESFVKIIIKNIREFFINLF